VSLKNEVAPKTIRLRGGGGASFGVMNRGLSFRLRNRKVSVRPSRRGGTTVGGTASAFQPTFQFPVWRVGNTLVGSAGLAIRGGVFAGSGLVTTGGAAGWLRFVHKIHTQGDL
jgi:hypothetical protein